MTNGRDVICGKVNVRGASCVEEEMKLIESFLRRNGVRGLKRLLYTGIRGTKKKMQEILERGIAGTKTSTYAHSAEEMITEDTGNLIALDYASMHKNQLVLVYDGDQLTDDPRSTEQFLDAYEYIPIEGKTFRDALKAIIMIKNTRR